jgi:peptidyl-prolyl cis-trans isomerase D
MLQTLRDKTTGWIAFLILGLVSVPFAFFGIEQYFEVRTPNYVAKVGDKEISQNEFRERFEQYRQNARRQLGDSYDPSYFEQPLVKRQMLEQMVNEELLTQAAAVAGTEASDDRVRREIAELPAFQTDGKFDPTQYQLLLRSQSPPLSVAEFESRIRRDISSRELPTAVGGSSLVTDAAVNRYLSLRDQLRDFSYFVVPAVDIAPVEPEPAAIDAYYEANKSEFMTDEQVSLAYIELNAAALEVPTEADEATLRERVEEQKNRYFVGEQRLASHILVKVAADADPDALRIAQEKAADLAARARAPGADFAALAREFTDDIGSKAQGGDLGWVEKGLTQPAFETALFAMTAGQVSDPVKTDEGFHVIQLREVQAERSKAFEEVQAELAEQYRTGERDRVFNERSGQLIDQIYKDPLSIEPAAAALGVEVQRTALFGRAGGEGIAAVPAVLREAFSDRVLAEGGLSDPIDLGPNHIAVIKLEEHKPSVTRPLEEVRAQVVARINAEAARTASADRARALDARLQQNESLAGLAAEVATPVVDAAAVGRAAINHDSAVVAEAFKLPRPAEGQTVRRMVELPGDRFALVELRGVTEGDPSKADTALRDAVRTQLQQATAAAETRSLLDAVRESVEVRIVEERM